MLAQDETGTAVPVAIETVEAGDLVWSRDEHTGEEGFKQVVRLFRNEADTLVDLSYTTSSGSGTLTGTEEHPFWSVTRGTWVAMAALDAGEQLLLTGGMTATVTAVEIEHLPTPVTVYNFEVADWHTYYVGTAAYGWVWVHNTCKVSPKTGNLLELRPSKGGAGPNRWQRVIADGESLSQARPKMAQVGNPGTSPGIRELPGTGSNARQVYDAMTKGGTVIPHPSGLTITKMPDGSFVTFRAAGIVPNAATGIAPPTIDINVPGQPLLKWKMLP